MPRQDECKIYKDKKDEWRLQRIAPNGKTVGASTEGYKNKSDCKDNAERNMTPCPIIELE